MRFTFHSPACSGASSGLRPDTNLTPNHTLKKAILDVVEREKQRQEKEKAARAVAGSGGARRKRHARGGGKVEHTRGVYKEIFP